MTGELTIRIARGSAAAGLVDAGWDELNLLQDRPHAAAGREWMAAILEWPGARPLVARAERAGRPVAALALDVRPLTPRGGPAIGRPLAAPRPASGADLLVAPGESAAGVALLRALGRELGAIEATVPADGPLATALPAAFRWARSEPTPETSWVLDLPGERLARRRERVAYHLRRAERRGTRIERRVHADPPAVAAALERLMTLHRARWSGRSDAVRFAATEDERAWHRAAVAAAATADRARLVEVVEDGRPVAAILVLLAGAAAALYVGAIESGGVLKGPGHVAILLAIEAAMANGARSVSLGRGEEEYKMRFGPAARENVRLVAAGRAGAQVPVLTALAAQRAVVRLRRRARRAAFLRAGDRIDG